MVISLHISIAKHEMMKRRCAGHVVWLKQEARSSPSKSREYETLDQLTKSHDQESRVVAIFRAAISKQTVQTSRSITAHVHGLISAALR